MSQQNNSVETYQSEEIEPELTIKRVMIPIVHDSASQMSKKLGGPQRSSLSNTQSMSMLRLQRP